MTNPHHATHGHLSTAQVRVAAVQAFDFLKDPIRLGRWSLGCFDTREAGGGLYTGASLYDGAAGWFRIVAHADLLQVEYHLGTREKLVPRVVARVVPGADLGGTDALCAVSLIAWRTVDMDDERWERLCTAHDAEIWLIKHQLETAAAGAP